MVLKSSYTPQPNICKSGYKAMKHLKRNKSRLVLIAGKGLAMVVMDKAKNLLEQPIYRPLPADATIKHNSILIHILKRIKKNQA